MQPRVREEQCGAFDVDGGAFDAEREQCGAVRDQSRGVERITELLYCDPS